jgi:hypothetical protein
MKSKPVQIFKVYQKKNEPSYGTGQTETFYMKVIQLDNKYFSAILDPSELKRAFNFIVDTELSGWLFTSYYVEIDDVFYQTGKIYIDESIFSLTFHFSDKFTQNPFNIKW